MTGRVTADEARAALRELGARRARGEAISDEAAAGLREWLPVAREAGLTTGEIARETGWSRQWVNKVSKQMEAG